MKSEDEKSLVKSEDKNIGESISMSLSFSFIGGALLWAVLWGDADLFNRAYENMTTGFVGLLVQTFLEWWRWVFPSWVTGSLLFGLTGFFIFIGIMEFLESKKNNKLSVLFFTEVVSEWLFLLGFVLFLFKIYLWDGGILQSLKVNL